MNRKNKISPEAIPHNSNSNLQAQQRPQHQQENSAIGIKRDPLKQQSKQHIKQIQPINQQALFTCRICLEQSPPLHANNEQQLKSMLALLDEQQKLKQPKHVITTCRCQGTSGYIHQKCMIQWIDAQYKRSKQKQMKCQICLAQILYDRKTIPYFEVTFKNLQHVSACNIACLVSVTLVLAIFIILETQAAKLSLNDITKITIFILIAILVISMGISMAIIVKEAFYKTRKQTIKVYSNDQIDICGIRKDNLTHYDRRSSTHRTQTNIRSARSIRSVRSMRDIQSERRNQHNQQNQSRNQNSHRQRSQRSNTQARQNQQRQAPRSQRSVRSVRMPQSSRSIQVRSRQQIEQPIPN